MTSSLILHRGSPKCLLVTMCIVLGLTLTQSAAPKTKLEPAAKPLAEAHLRLWKGQFPSKRAVRVSMQASGRQGDATELVDSADGLYFAEYSEVPSGAWTIEVTDVSDPKLKLASLSTQLAADSFSTLLLQEGADGVTAEILDDRPGAPTSCELVVRNFYPEVAMIQVDAGADLHFKISSPEAFLQIHGLPHKKMEVQTSGADASGKTFQWSNEVDFSQYRRATLILQPDSYGRMRPRITIDGQFAKPPGSKPKKGAQ